MWLDDCRDPACFGRIGWYWVQTIEEAKALLLTGNVIEASLDHDLGIWATLGEWERELTGYDLLLWMEENNIWPVHGVHVHSANPVGAKRMKAAIEDHYKRLDKNG